MQKDLIIEPKHLKVFVLAQIHLSGCKSMSEYAAKIGVKKSALSDVFVEENWGAKRTGPTLSRLGLEPAYWIASTGEVLSPKEVPEYLESQVKILDMNYSEFARHLGIALNSLQHVIYGKRPPARTHLDAMGLEMVYQIKKPEKTGRKKGKV